MHIRYSTLQTCNIPCIYKHTILYTLWIHCVVRYRMSYIRHRMLTYDIEKTYDIVHTISYVQECNIVYTISYIRYGIRHPKPDIRYRMWQESRWPPTTPAQGRILGPEDHYDLKGFSFIQTAKLAESEGTLRASGMRPGSIPINFS